MKLALIASIGAAGLLAGCTEEYVTPPPPVAAVIPAPQAGAAVVAVVPGAPASAVVAAPMDDNCFRTSDITNHQIGDDHTMYVRTREGGVWRLAMAGSCLAAASSDDPIVMREPPGVPYACRAIDLDISIRHMGSGGMATPCIVQSMTRLTANEVSALPDRLRP